MTVVGWGTGLWGDGLWGADSTPGKIGTCTIDVEVEPRAWGYQHHVHFPTDHPEIDGTGTVEVRDQIQAVFDAALPGTYFTSSPTQEYLVNGTNLGTLSNDPMGWRSRQHLWFDGKGCTFKQTIAGPFTTTKTDSTSVQVVKNLNLHRAFWAIYNSAHWGIWNVNHEGPSTKFWSDDDAYDARYETQHVFDLKGNDDFEIGDDDLAHITAGHTYGDMFCFAPSDETHLSNTNGRIGGYTFHDGGRQGCTLNGLADSYIRHFDQQRIRHSQFDIEPNFTGSAIKPKLRNVLVTTGHLGNQRLNSIASGNAEAMDFDGVVFQSIDNDNANGWKVDIGDPPARATNRRRNFALINSTSSSPFGDTTGHGLKFANIDGLTVTGNALIMQSRSPAMTAVYALNCTGVDVHANSTPGAVAELLVVGSGAGAESGTCTISVAAKLSATGFVAPLFNSATIIARVGISASGVAGSVGDCTISVVPSITTTGIGTTPNDVEGDCEIDIPVMVSATGLGQALSTALIPVQVSIAVDGIRGVIGDCTITSSSAVSVEGAIRGVIGDCTITAAVALMAVGRGRGGRRGASIGAIRIRPPGYGEVPFGQGPYGGI